MLSCPVLKRESLLYLLELSREPRPFNFPEPEIEFFELGLSPLIILYPAVDSPPIPRILFLGFP